MKKNINYFLLTLAFITAPMLAMEKHPADSTQKRLAASHRRNDPKKARREIQPLTGQSHLEQLPLEITEIILGYLATAKGKDEDSQIRNAAKNMRHFMSLSKTMSALESNLATHKQVIPALAKGNKENFFNAAIALHTNGSSEWIKEVFPVENRKIYCNRALYHAIQAGDAPSVAFIIQHEPQSVNQKITNDGATPLIQACASGYKEIVAILLKAKANVFDKNFNNETALWHAATRGDVEIAEMLIKKAPLSSTPETPNLHTLLNSSDQAQWHKPLARAIVHEHVPMAQLLLNKGANPNNTFTRVGTPAFDKVTVLLHASQMGNLEIVELLLSAGADINTRSNGYKATHQGAFIKTADMSALMLSAQNGHRAVVQRLLQEPSIDVCVQSIEGKTALDLATESNSENKNEIIRLLKEHSKEKNKKKKKI